jgi:hypothetical protein
MVGILSSKAAQIMIFWLDFSIDSLDTPSLLNLRRIHILVVKPGDATLMVICMALVRSLGQSHTGLIPRTLFRQIMDVI